MKIKNKKINNRGVALLFSIMLSMVFLTIAVGVLNIAVKELNFSSSAKDTNNAFFAADSGVECALYNDRTDQTTFTKGSTGMITCLENKDLELKGTFPDFSFIVPGLGGNDRSCAKVIISKTTDGAEPPTVLSTVITSRGYNVGDENCDSTATNRIERVLEVNY